MENKKMCPTCKVIEMEILDCLQFCYRCGDCEIREGILINIIPTIPVKKHRKNSRHNKNKSNLSLF